MSQFPAPSSEPNPQPGLEAILQWGIFEIESSAAEIADLAHPTSSISIEVQKHHPVTGVLPDELLQYFESRDIPATAISSVNVSADYVNDSQCFTPTKTEIILNEGTSLEFAQSPTLARMNLVHFQMLRKPNPEDTRPKIATKSSVLQASEFQDIMARMQLDIPIGQNLDLSTITKTLQFTERWKVKFSKDVPLNPQQIFRIEDTYFRGIRDEGRVAFGYNSGQQWSRTLKIGLDEPLDGFTIPTSTTQLILRSEEQNATPRLSRIVDVPISYAPEEDDILLSAFVEHPLRRRIEDQDESRTVNPTIPILSGFYNTLESVRMALKEELPL